MFRIPNQNDAGFARQAGWHSSDVDAIATGLAGDGVLTGLGVTSQPIPNMTVAAEGGQARVFGYYPALAPTNVAVSAAHPSQPRIDLVCIDYNGILSVAAGTPSTVPIAPSAPINSIPLAQIYVPPGVTEIQPWYIVDKRVIVPDYFDVVDEFVTGASVVSGNIAFLDWAYTANGIPGLSFVAGASSHPGVLSISTGSVSGDDTRLHLGVSPTSDLSTVPTDVARMRAIINFTTPVSAMRFKFGIGRDISDVTSDAFGTSGAWFEFNSTDSANWQTETRDLSTTQTNTDTQAVVQGSWYQLDIVRIPNGNWQFIKNGVLLFTHDQNQPTFNVLPGFVIESNSAAARAFSLDFFGMNFAPLGDRWS